MMKIGFDNAKYIELQSEHIRERIGHFGNKLYLEFGGKLFDDYHASRVLPGFKPDSKIHMLEKMADKAEIVIAINAKDIEKNKIRGDLGIRYDDDVLRLIEAFRGMGLYVGSVVITQYANQFSADKFKGRLEGMGIPVYLHYPIPGYPGNISLVVSEDGYGRNEYIKTSRPLVVVTAPGPGSGKLATCLSQLYHEYKRGIAAGYAKFETFPIWNLPLNHPINLAYEAATADLNDVNMIDPFHLAAYGKTSVNYNRDVEAFPLLSTIFEKIMGSSPYKSPTDMGVNMIGYCITDDEICSEAAKDEIIRRYYDTMCARMTYSVPEEAVYKTELIMKQAGVSPADRPVVGASLAKAEETGRPASAIQLENGKIITGKTSSLLGASSAMLLNVLKELGSIDDSVQLLSPEVIAPIQSLKIHHLGNHNPRLHTDEVLIALSVCAASDPNAAKTMEQLSKLKGLNVHSTVRLSAVDMNVFKKLGVYLTCEPVYEIKKIRKS